MDILKNISEKVKALPQDMVSDGVKAVLTHIEVAEKYLQRAKIERDTHLYTDVIYRTNHAFEGILKEAYTTLENKNANSVTPFEIEEYLSKNAVFRDRVMELFTNYRTHWRNPSTHEYSLFFSEQEAFLAIVTVSAFVSILIDQITEKVSFRLEKERLEKSASTILASIKNYPNLDPVDKVAQILLKLEAELVKNIASVNEKSGAQLVGVVAGYLKSLEPELSIDFEPNIVAYGKTIKPDLLVELDKQKIILELKRTLVSPHLDDNEHELLLSEMAKMLAGSSVKNGIIFYFPYGKNVDSVLTFPGLTQNSETKIRIVHAVDKGMYEEPQDNWDADVD